MIPFPELLAYAKSHVLITNTMNLGSTGIEYLIFEDGTDNPHKRQFGLYDEKGTPYVSSSAFNTDPLFADFVAFHEYEEAKELESAGVLNRTAMNMRTFEVLSLRAHYSALTKELVKAKELGFLEKLLDYRGFDPYIESVLKNNKLLPKKEFSRWKLENREQRHRWKRYN